MATGVPVTADRGETENSDPAQPAQPASDNVPTMQPAQQHAPSDHMYAVPITDNLGDYAEFDPGADLRDDEAEEQAQRHAAYSVDSIAEDTLREYSSLNAKALNAKVQDMALLCGLGKIKLGEASRAVRKAKQSRKLHPGRASLDALPLGLDKVGGV